MYESRIIDIYLIYLIHRNGIFIMREQFDCLRKSQARTVHFEQKAPCLHI